MASSAKHFSDLNSRRRVVIAVILTWILVSAWSVIVGSPSQFQRAGAIGIAAAILYGTVFRRLAQWMLGEHRAAAGRLSADNERIGDLPDLFDLLPDDTRSRRLTDTEFAEYRKALDRHKERNEQAEEVGRKLEIAEGLELQGLRLEIPVVCVATLQTGYGDLLLTILKG